MKNVRKEVKKKYAEAITLKTGCCDGTAKSCCSGGLVDAVDPITRDLYSLQDLQGLNQDLIATSFGCGNPTALAELIHGETVLDLGSGAGLDVLLSAKRVGPTGKAYGLDMTDEMLAVANENRKKAGLENVEFLKGHIEEIPLPDNTVDVIISNCVINLSGDKDKVIQEAFRVLKMGGRLTVSDIVLKKPLPAKIREDILAWSGCVAGALLEEEYRAKLAQVGFSKIEVQFTRAYDMDDPQIAPLLQSLSMEETEQIKGSVVSAIIWASKGE